MVTDAVMLRLLRSGVLAAPHPLAPPHSCCWIVDGEDCEPCGLWCGHDGDHTSYVPGAYLPPPIIGPLDVLPIALRRPGRCPLCRRRVDSYRAEETLALRDVGDGWREPEHETEWRFEPCGCEGREILPEATAPY